MKNIINSPGRTPKNIVCVGAGMFYIIENGMIRTCIWLPLRYVERIAIKDHKFIYEKHEHREEFVGVRPEDCRRICSTGCAKLRIFNSITEDSHILRLAYEPPQPEISVRIRDMVILKKDSQQFETIYKIQEYKQYNSLEKETFTFSEDFRYVKLHDLEFNFGDIQARIIKLLFDASKSHNPWVHSKTLIFESGSNAIRLRDLFKKKSKWDQLVISDKRGYYRLNVPIEKSSKTSV